MQNPVHILATFLCKFLPQYANGTIFKTASKLERPVFMLLLCSMKKNIKKVYMTDIQGWLLYVDSRLYCCVRRANYHQFSLIHSVANPFQHLTHFPADTDARQDTGNFAVIIFQPLLFVPPSTKYINIVFTFRNDYVIDKNTGENRCKRRCHLSP